MTQIQVPIYAQGSCGVTHVDRGMIGWLRDEEHVRSLYDIGCGPGGQVMAARTMGLEALGIDVDPTMYRRPGVALADFCTAPLQLQPADAVWSVETAEHIPPQHVDTYIDTLTSSARRVIVMTASQMPAELHVSVHRPEWWIERVESRPGWSYVTDSPDLIDEHSTMEREFMRETGMIFVRDTNAPRRLLTDDELRELLSDRVVCVVAERCGLHRRTIDRLKSGESSPRARAREALSQYLSK